MSLNEQQVKPMINALRKKRVALNYSQEYMAAKMGFTQKGYSKLELGTVKMTIDRFLIMCELLDILPGDIFEQMRTEKALLTI